MSAPDLHGKTIRPGSLNGFSYYYSRRQPNHPQAAKPDQNPGRKSRRKLLLGLLIVLAVPAAVLGYRAHYQPVVADRAAAAQHQAAKTVPSKAADKAPAVAAAPATTKCMGNTLDKLIAVDISERHLWACEGTNVVYDTPVVTGMEDHASTLTPPGTYHIYSKQTDVTLRGSDETGSWNDPVSYWMPFLSNKYGIYGFHDATWRDDSAFGNIDPSSDDASHGCVELPLAASAWLYNWAVVGTTLTITS